jgi:MarR family 2-MHQ and catechol resistance regulon transcriptional repressor
MMRIDTGKEKNTAGVHVWLILMKAFRSLARHAQISLRKTGLGDSDFRVLELLLHKGPLPVNTIGPKVDLTPGSISVAVDRLESKELVVRKGDPEDRRIRIVELTSQGRQLISKIFQRHADAMERAVEGLSEEERETLISLLKKMGKHAEDQGDSTCVK